MLYAGVSWGRLLKAEVKVNSGVTGFATDEPEIHKRNSQKMHLAESMHAAILMLISVKYISEAELIAFL